MCAGAPLSGELLHQVAQRAHQLAVCRSPAQQADAVQKALGSRLAAAALGVRNQRNLLRWGDGGPIRHQDTEHRLQILYRLVTAISLAHQDAAAVAFMRACNPHLGNRTPLDVLANERPTRAEPRLLTAVEALLSRSGQEQPAVRMQIAGQT